MKLLALALAFAVIPACSKKDGGGGDSGKVASCMSESMHSCREYRGANLAAGSDNLAKLCTTIDTTAKFTATACPTAKLVGRCTKPEGSDFYYDGYPMPVADAEKMCKEGGGTFTK